MPSPTPTTDTNKDYYEILNIPSVDSSSGKLPIISKQQLKNAYHKALLKHHPDKYSPSPTPAPGEISSTYTIDDVTNAYKVLSDPVLRAEYDRDLILRRRNDSFNKAAGKADDVLFHTGLEVVDLEDMNEQDDDVTGSSIWHRGCRCGDEKGFIVTEDELEAEAQHGEILVGCRGCSLWIKVLFAVEEDQPEEGEEREENGSCFAGGR
jgi:diphthamide biosynthesis protein 4